MKEHTANHSFQKIIIRKYFQFSHTHTHTHTHTLKYNNLNKTFLKEKDVS